MSQQPSATISTTSGHPPGKEIESSPFGYPPGKEYVLHVWRLRGKEVLQIRPSAWKGESLVRVGIHVRAGDVRRRDKWMFGYTIPRRPYFEQAMSRFSRYLSAKRLVAGNGVPEMT